MFGSKHRQHFCRYPGVSSPEKNLEIVIAKSCNVMHFGFLKHCNSWNGVPPLNDHCVGYTFAINDDAAEL